MGAFGDVVLTLAEMDIIPLFFPWLLVLAVTFGVLEKYNVFSEDAQVNGVISLAVAFLAVGGAALYMPEGLMTTFAAALTFSIFGILGMMILLAVAGVNVEEVMNKDELPAIIAVVLVIISFIGALVFSIDLSGLVGGVENVFDEVVMPILVLVFLIIVVALTAGGS